MCNVAKICMQLSNVYLIESKMVTISCRFWEKGPSQSCGIQVSNDTIRQLRFSGKYRFISGIIIHIPHELLYCLRANRLRVESRKKTTFLPRILLVRDPARMPAKDSVHKFYKIESPLFQESKRPMHQ